MHLLTHLHQHSYNHVVWSDNSAIITCDMWLQVYFSSVHGWWSTLNLLQSLHRLPVTARIQCKSLTRLFQQLHWQWHCSHVSLWMPESLYSSRPLRSSTDSQILSKPRLLQNLGPKILFFYCTNNLEQGATQLLISSPFSSHCMTVDLSYWLLPLFHQIQCMNVDLSYM